MDCNEKPLDLENSVYIWMEKLFLSFKKKNPIVLLSFFNISGIFLP